MREDGNGSFEKECENVSVKTQKGLNYRIENPIRFRLEITNLEQRKRKESFSGAVGKNVMIKLTVYFWN
jgi:hypothetical protein